MTARNALRAAASVGLIAAAVVLLYRKATRLWWTYDDVWHLHTTIVRAWTEPFTERDVWPQKLFTPLLLATHEALLALAGLDPGRWYVAQLVLIAACGVAIFFALRLYLPRVAALGGGLLFVAGPPLCSFATQIMVVHYLEAILLGTLAVIAFVIACRRGSRVLIAVSALLYLGAMLAKEIAVPLPFLLLALPELRLRVRAQHLVLHAGVGTVYLGWRYSVVGTLLGGYGWAIAVTDIPRLLATLPWKIVLAMAGSSLAIGLTALAIVAVGVAAALRRRHALVIAAATLLLAVAPILPVSKEMQRRYAVMPWLWVCATFATGVASLPKRPRNALIAAAVATVIVANRQEWAAEYARSMRMSTEGRAFMSLSAGDLLRRPAIPPAALGELRWLKEEHLGRSRGAGWFYDDIFLCAGGLGGAQVYEYAPQRRQVVDVTAPVQDHAPEYCSSIRDDVPLRAEFRHRDDALFWRFGPYADGRWSVVLGDGVQAFEVPREDGFRLAGVPGIALRVRYDSPEGWVTYSPELALDFTKQPDLTWQR